MTNLKNVNFMSQSKFDTLTKTADDELYAVSQSVAGMPDYSAGVSVTSGGTVPFDGYIKLLGNTNTNPSLFLDGVIAIGGYGGQGNNFCGSAMCYKGQKITTNVPVGSIKSITCYPFRGVN